MARDPNLKSLYSDLEPDEREMALYRNRLALTLNKRPRRLSHPLLGWLAAVAVGCGFLLWLLSNQNVDFQQIHFEELQKLVSSTAIDDLTSSAREALAREDDLERLNAMATLCMVLPVNEGIPLASKALLSEPRAEFRVFYLEFLLEEADENLINFEKVEALLDEEEDLVCIRLYRDLLELS